MTDPIPKPRENIAFCVAIAALFALIATAFWMADCAALTTIDLASAAPSGVSEKARIARLLRGSRSVPIAVQLAPSLGVAADLLPLPSDRAELSVQLQRDRVFIGVYVLGYLSLAGLLWFRPGSLGRPLALVAVLFTALTAACDWQENEATLRVLSALSGDYRPQTAEADRARVTPEQERETQSRVAAMRSWSQAKWYACFATCAALAVLFLPPPDQIWLRRWHLLGGSLLLLGSLLGLALGYDSPRFISWAFLATLAGSAIALPLLLHASPAAFWRRAEAA